MDPTKIIDGWNMNIQNLKYWPAKITDKGARIISPKSRPLIRGTVLKTWGANDFKGEGEEVGNGKFKLGLQFSVEDDVNVDDANIDLDGDDEASEALREAKFKKNMAAFEEELKKDLFVNSVQWFGKAKSKEIIEELYNPILKYPKTNNVLDKTRAPRFDLKMQRYNDEWKFELFDDNGAKLYPNPDDASVDPLQYIIKKTKVAYIFQFNGFTIINQNIYPSLQLMQLQVSLDNPVLEGTCHLTLKKSTKSGTESAKAPTHRASATFVDDGEGDEGNEDDEDNDDDEQSVLGRKRKPSFSVVHPPTTDGSNSFIEGIEGIASNVVAETLPDPDVDLAATQEQEQGQSAQLEQEQEQGQESAVAAAATGSGSGSGSGSSEEPLKKKKTIIKKKEEKKVV
jgi:hypothetical protein